MFNIPSADICVLREGVDEQQIPWQQFDNFNINDIELDPDTSPDRNAIKEAFGVSSQEKAINIALQISARVLGI